MPDRNIPEGMKPEDMENLWADDQPENDQLENNQPEDDQPEPLQEQIPGEKGSAGWKLPKLPPVPVKELQRNARRAARTAQRTARRTVRGARRAAGAARRYQHQAMKAFAYYQSRAAELLRDPEKLEDLLVEAEEQARTVPKVGRELAYVPEIILLVRSYIRKDYTEISLPKMITIVASLLYFVLPFDIIPDTVPLAGFLDDALVTGIVVKLCNDDLDRYMKWLKRERAERDAAAEDGDNGQEEKRDDSAAVV